MAFKKKNKKLENWLKKQARRKKKKK